MTARTVGSYEVLKQIGEGGCGRTYLVRHLLLDEIACLKQNLFLSEAEVELLLREARLLWNIHHHSLPTLRDFIRIGEFDYALIMSFIRGKELFKIVREDYPDGIDPEHVCWMMQRLLNALNYLHFFGVIHGDVKPQNIIIQPKEHNAVLVDYGLSVREPGSGTESIGCTSEFAAPEQLGGFPPLPETDLYCLGLSMIYALGGNIVGKTFPLHVPQPIQDFISLMVVHDPRHRPKSAGDLVGELSQIRVRVFGRRSSSKELSIS